MEINDDVYEDASPRAASLIQSLRAFGYDSPTALSDLIDNSISAKAKTIWLQFTWDSDTSPWVALSDDGTGMTEARLTEAMRLGSVNPLEERREDDLGRFGLGLKTASFSQCRRLTVATKTKDDASYSVRCWDLDFVTQKNSWLLQKQGSELLNSFADCFFAEHDSGTVVFWEKIDRMVPDGNEDSEANQKAFLDEIEEVKARIATVFSGYMSGRGQRRFYVNGRLLELKDPFMSEHPQTMRLATDEVMYKGQVIRISPFILPRTLTSEEVRKYGNPETWEASSGFYIYRNDRLIVAGNWLFRRLVRRDVYKLARIRIDIGNRQDSEWGIDVRKSKAKPPIEIRDDLLRIAQAARAASSKAINYRGKSVTHMLSPKSITLWKQFEKYGKLTYVLNLEHPILSRFLDGPNGDEMKNLFEMIEETVPVPLLISDYTTRRDLMLKPYEAKDTTFGEEAFESVFNKLLAEGKSRQMAMEMLEKMEPYCLFPDELAEFRSKKGL